MSVISFFVLSYSLLLFSIVFIGCLYFWVVFMLKKVLPLSSCRVLIYVLLLFLFRMPALITRDKISSSVETLYPYNLL